VNGVVPTVSVRACTPTSSLAVTRKTASEPVDTGFGLTSTVTCGRVVSATTVRWYVAAADLPYWSVAVTVTAYGPPMLAAAVAQVIRPAASMATPAGGLLSA